MKDSLFLIKNSSKTTNKSKIMSTIYKKTINYQKRITKNLQLMIVYFQLKAYLF
jgi:hypothetical protein